MDEIDINQLPIPAWGLACPTCNYALDGLPAHRCPECGTAFEMREVIQTWTRLRDPIFTGSERPLPDFGVSCPSCEGALAGAEGDACPHCGEVFSLEPPAHGRPSMAGWFRAEHVLSRNVPQVTLVALLIDNHIPYRIDAAGSLRKIYSPEPVVADGVWINRDFFFDFLAAVHETLTTHRDEWTCPICGESVPGSFDVCWACDQADDAERDDG